jgi:hypothetical protein
VKQKTFCGDPKWKKAKASEAKRPLVPHIDGYFMDRTSFAVLN